MVKAPRSKDESLYLHGPRHASQRRIFPNPVFLSPLFLMYVLRTALRVLRSPEEKTWILSKLDELSKA